MFRRRTQQQEVEQQEQANEQEEFAPRRLTDEERVIRRAMGLMENGKARSWSHAIAIAADTLPRKD